jgi:hypothetical protein
VKRIVTLAATVAVAAVVADRGFAGLGGTPSHRMKPPSVDEICWNNAESAVVQMTKGKGRGSDTGQ